MITVEHVSHAFGRPSRGQALTRVLEDVDLGFVDGMFVSLLGPSGCGKTTLLRIVDGLVKPDEGRVLVDGVEVHGPAANRSMVFQECNLLPWRTVQQNAEFGLELQGVERSARTHLATEALRAVGLDAFRRHYPHQLSGGMKQLVGLARAFCTRPQYLLMDEPFGALDLQLRELMQIELMKLWESDRKTVLFVTHSVDEAIFLSDRVIVFSPRPARVVDVVDIHLPRPRWQDDEIKLSPEFQNYRRRLWNQLKRVSLAGPGLASSMDANAAGSHAWQ